MINITCANVYLYTEKARMVLSISMPMRDQDLITIDSVNSSCDSAEIMLPLDVNNIGIHVIIE